MTEKLTEEEADAFADKMVKFFTEQQEMIRAQAATIREQQEVIKRQADLINDAIAQIEQPSQPGAHYLH